MNGIILGLFTSYNTFSTMDTFSIFFMNEYEKQNERKAIMKDVRFLRRALNISFRIVGSLLLACKLNINTTVYFYRIVK